MSLSLEERERYSRQLLMPEIGGQGQHALKAARLLVIGAGGLGSPILMALTAAGIGTIGICDGDRVDRSNLNRQTLYDPQNLGRPKASTAAEKLRRFNPHTTIEVYDTPMTAENAASLFSAYDMIIEGLDRFAPRYVVNDTCLALKKPWISAAIGRFDGQVAFFDPTRKNAPCYGCLVPSPPQEEAGCEVSGVLGTTTAIVGSLAAHEAIKVICDFSTLSGHMLIHEGKTSTTRRISLPRDPQCPHCANSGP